MLANLPGHGIEGLGEGGNFNGIWNIEAVAQITTETPAAAARSNNAGTS